VGDNPQFPGGITGPGKGTDYAVFTKGTGDEATVTIIAPGQNTRWSYWAKCSEPGWRVPEAD